MGGILRDVSDLEETGNGETRGRLGRDSRKPLLLPEQGRRATGNHVLRCQGE